MNLGRIIAAVEQFQDITGKNAAGGKLYVFTEPSQTLNAATLYKVGSHSVLSNPLSINDEGQVEDFLVDSDFEYYVIVKDITGDEIFSRHNLTCVDGGEGAMSNDYYEGDFIDISDDRVISVDPVKRLAVESPLTLTESNTEVVVGIDTDQIRPQNYTGENGITVTGTVISGKNLKDWQDLHGKTLTVSVDGTSTTFDGTSDKTVTITSPTVGDGNMTVKVEGTTKQTFTANQTSNSEVDITRNDLNVYSKSETDERDLLFAMKNPYDTSKAYATLKSTGKTMDGESVTLKGFRVGDLKVESDGVYIGAVQPHQNLAPFIDSDSWNTFNSGSSSDYYGFKPSVNGSTKAPTIEKLPDYALKSELPTVGNGKTDLKFNGSVVGSVYANNSTDNEIDLGDKGVSAIRTGQRVTTEDIHSLSFVPSGSTSNPYIQTSTETHSNESWNFLPSWDSSTDLGKQLEIGWYQGSKCPVWADAGLKITPVYYNITTNEEITEMLSAGKTPILMKDNRISGFYKGMYGSNIYAFVTYTYAQPMRVIEYWCDTEDVWHSSVYYPTDMTSTNSFYVDSINTQYGQRTYTGSTLSWTTDSHFNNYSWKNAGYDTESTYTTEKAILGISNMELAKYQFSDTVDLLVYSDIGTTVPYLKVSLILRYWNDNGGSTHDVICPWAPTQYIALPGAYQISEKTYTTPVNINYQVDIPRGYYKGYIGKSDNTEVRFILKYELYKLPSSLPTGTVVQLGQRFTRKNLAMWCH